MRLGLALPRAELGADGHDVHPRPAHAARTIWITLLPVERDARYRAMTPRRLVPARLECPSARADAGHRRTTRARPHAGFRAERPEADSLALLLRVLGCVPLERARAGHAHQNQHRA